jgi:flagellar basal body-associated protein FliL
MIRANDRGLASPPAVVEEPSRPGLVNTRNIIILVGVIAWLAVLLLFVVPQLTRKPAQQGAAPVTAQTAAEAAQPATAAQAKPGAAATAPKAVASPQLNITGRVFNLAGNASGYKYVKLSLAVQFADEKGGFAKAKGDALTKMQAAFATENQSALSAFNDVLTTTVSSKTAADLATTQGKEALRQELITKFNQALAGSSERVTYVTFSDFVMQ